jgi:methionine-rich copper-binding protein CopC
MNRSTATLLAALILLPCLVQAHAKLVQATPANGSALNTPPAAVTLVFNEAATLTALSVLKSGDKEARKLGPIPKTPAAKFSVALPNLGAGSYTVSYRVLSDDNHVMSGTLKFTIATDGSVLPR